jgi:hypothetical protein
MFLKGLRKITGENSVTIADVPAKIRTDNVALSKQLSKSIKKNVMLHAFQRELRINNSTGQRPSSQANDPSSD